MAQHIEDPAALAIGVFVKFAGIFEIVPDNWFVPESIHPKPLARGLPALIVGLILAVTRFAPDIFQERGESFIEPDVAPVLAGDQVAKPLVAEFVGDQAVFSGEVFGRSEERRVGKECRSRWS